MYSVAKKFEFEACHKLNLDYDSPCKNMHGHSYKVEITVFCDQLDKNGMIIDFGELKPVKEWVDDNWDHAIIMSETDPLLNDREFINNQKIFRYPYNVTAENMAKTIHEITINRIHQKMNGRQFNVEVAIWETSNNKATYSDLGGCQC